MKEVGVLCAEAFSNQVNKGNPAGIVFDANWISYNEMQSISNRIGFNETVFILESKVADIRLRYFTPNHEMNLCGHGTVASICELMSRNNIKNSKSLSIETLAGILKVYYDNYLHEVTMEQSPAKFRMFNGDIEKLASSIGINIADIDDKYPIVYGSTGTWTILIPIKHIETFKNMKPNNKEFSGVLKEIPTSSVHPFSLETIYPNNDMHGRHFSATHSGTVEDPITGTASGVMGAYYIKYIKDVNNIKLRIEQGQEIGKDGLVKASAAIIDNKIEVSISGTSIFIEEKILKI